MAKDDGRDVENKGANCLFLHHLPPSNYVQTDFTLEYVARVAFGEGGMHMQGTITPCFVAVWEPPLDYHT